MKPNRLMLLMLVIVSLALLATVALSASTYERLAAERLHSCDERNEVRLAMREIVEGAIEAGRHSNDIEYARRFEAVAAATRSALDPHPCH